MGWTHRHPWARMQRVAIPVPPRSPFSPLTLSYVLLRGFLELENPSEVCFAVWGLRGYSFFCY